MAVRLGMDAGIEMDQCATNPQDAVVIRLLLEGVTAEEIAGLRASQIDAETRTIALSRRKGGHRQHPISKTCLHLLQQALQQTSYPALLPDGTPCSLKLGRSAYVVKVSLWDHVGHEAFIQDPASVRLRAIYARLRALSERMPGGSAAEPLRTGADLVTA